MSAEKVLDVAMTAYWHSDPADVSLNEICQLAGVSKPSVYREFGSEDGLMRSALDNYAGAVLSDVFAILQGGKGLQETLDALIDFASTDPRMGTGCLFYKMRAGRHRLGPQTRSRVDEFDQAAVGAFEAYLESRRDAGDWGSRESSAVIARYMVEQIGLALTLRATLADLAHTKRMLALALSVIKLS